MNDKKQVEKQAIEEMVNTYYEAMLKAIGTLGSMNEGAPKWYAKAFYEAGYRKQKEGEWQTAPDRTHWCSECGHDATYTFDGTEICGVACPFCGAKMKGGAEG